ncbi:MAG: 30S ribosome-binding factor RbfA [Chloroflexota bacterium]
MTYRTQRINSLIREEISELLKREVKDPRLDDFISVTEVETSPDMKYARVFVSSLLSPGKEREETLKALESASGFIRHELAQKLRLRRIPELTFAWDDSIERGSKLLRLIDRVSAEGPEDDHGHPERQ